MENAKMVRTLINDKYMLWLPEHRAVRPEWKTGWEVERIEAMLKVISSTDTVFDIGTEEGDISAIIAKETQCKMVMIEPNDRVWSCIEAIWEANKLDEPIRVFPGFFSANNTHVTATEHGSFVSSSKELIPDHGFKQLYENYPDVPQITMDRFCHQTGIYPTVITMDVEGAEFEVIKGAENVLREHKPIIFMSVHPEFMFESYRNEGIWKERYGERQHVVHMLRFIDEIGYTHRCIEYDYHELHMVFEPK